MGDGDGRLPRRSLVAGLAATVAALGTGRLLTTRGEGGADGLTVDPVAGDGAGGTAAPSESPTPRKRPLDSGRDPAAVPAPEPAPETEQSAAAPAAAPGFALLCRDAWGARPVGDGLRPHTLQRLTLHHTAVVLGDNANAPGRLRQHQRFHQQQGWADLAYHYAVDREGHAYEGRPVTAAGDTFTSYDPAGHFLVVCEGDFGREEPSEAQLETVAGLFAWAVLEHGIDPATLAGHGDHAATSCPGTALVRVLRDGSLRARVDRRVAEGVTVDHRCGPEGAALVAAIEG